MINHRVVFTGPKQVEVEEIAVPEPGPGQMLVHNLRSAISTGTELTILAGEFPEGSVWQRMAKYPCGSGYSSVGAIIEVGEKLDGFKVGDRVTCGSNHCRYAVQAPSNHLLKVPEGVDLEPASLYRFAEITMNGVRRGQPVWGECAVVYGLGIIGQFVAAFARLAGCRPVIGVDISPLRLGLAEKMGIDYAFDGNNEDLVGEIEKVNHGRRADLVYETTGLGEIIPKEMDLLKRQGRIVIVSSPRTKTLIDLHDYCNSASYTIIGAHNGSHPAFETPYNQWTQPRNLELFMDYLVRGELAPAPLITHRYEWRQAPQAYQMLLEDRGNAGTVILDWTKE